MHLQPTQLSFTAFFKGPENLQKTRDGKDGLNFLTARVKKTSLGESLAKSRAYRIIRCEILGRHLASAKSLAKSLAESLTKSLAETLSETRFFTRVTYLSILTL